MIVGNANVGMMAAAGVEGWDLSTFSYQSKSFDPTAQAPAGSGHFVKGDGTKLYVLDEGNFGIFQYSITGGDISTASYDSKTFDVSTQISTAVGFFIGDSGSKFYVVDRNDDEIHQYTMSTPWDISTASYASKLKDVTAQTAQPRMAFFKPDGTKMYVSDNNGAVWQYTLGTSWDISTASYDSKTFSTGIFGAYSLAIKPDDGTKAFIVASNNDEVRQYTLSTPWDISTASYDTILLDTSSEIIGTLYSISFLDDGTTIYASDLNAAIYQYGV